MVRDSYRTRKDIIMLTQKELKRLHAVKKVFEGVIKQVKAAELLSLSDRQIRRLINRVKIEGDIGIAHKSRGKPSGTEKSLNMPWLSIYREIAGRGSKDIQYRYSKIVNWRRRQFNILSKLGHRRDL